ncbi:hypothetical protein [Paenibacillus sp. Soil750]|nr:hypothetical protein [Paenibacillus sp. Soil750]
MEKTCTFYQLPEVHKIIGTIDDLVARIYEFNCLTSMEEPNLKQ